MAPKHTLHEESVADPADRLADHPVFPGQGEMAGLMRAMDWSRTALGPVAGWSPSLRTMVRLLLANRFPLLLWWGPDFIQLYNDPYRPVLGIKHPQYLGRSVRECWSEIWDVIGPLIETPFQGGPATWMEDILLEINRYGFTEETHFTIAYSPVPDDTAPNRIGGVLATVHEITQKVVGDRRVLVLRDLGARSAEARSAEDACQIAATILAEHPNDIPFALFYLLDGDGRARLTASTGLAPAMADTLGTPFAPTSITLSAHLDGTGSACLWPLAAAAHASAPQIVTDLATRFAAVPSGPWSDPPHTAVVVPIPSNIAHQPAGLLVAGISARLRYDDAYAGFLDLVAGQIATAIATARAYEEQRQRAEALAALDHAKTAFFSNVSHEFRTPLTLMLGPLEDLLGANHLRPDTRGQVEMVHRNGLRLLKLVNTLLDFSRIEAGRAEAVYAPTDLAALTADLASAFRSLVERAGLRLVVDCPPLAGAVYVDREMWEKIVLNLLSNAFKFTFDGEITVSLRPTPPGGSTIELRVADTGTGIPPEEMPRLFERFHRIQGAASRTYEGSGIGLALVRDLVTLHGGSIRAESQPGVGTTFVVALPLGTAHLPAERIQASRTVASTALGAAPFVEEALRWLPGDSVGARTDAALDLPPEAGATSAGLDWQSATPAAPAAPDPAAPHAPPARVLLADDNADLRAYVCHLLGERYTVEAMSNGALALAAARERPPDLVLTDVMMPEMDGFALLRALRDDPHTRAIPVILLSARAGEEATVEGLAAGADDYLIKPFSARELLARVAAHLEMARVREEGLARARELEAIFAAMADSLVIYNADGTLRRWNAATAELFEFDRLPAYTGPPVDERPANIVIRDEENHPIPADDLPFMRATRGEMVTGAQAVDLIFTPSSQQEKHINASAAPLRDAAGHVAGAVAVYRDVTARRALEQRTHDVLEALLAMAETMVRGSTDVAGDLAENLADDTAADAQGGAADGLAVVRRVVTLAQRVLGGVYTSVVLLDQETKRADPLAVAGLAPEHEAHWWASVRGARPEDFLSPDDIARLFAGEDTIIVNASDQPPVPGQDYWGVQTSLVTPAHLGRQLVILTVEVRDRSTFTAQERNLARAAVQLVAMVIEREQLARERAAAAVRNATLAETNRRMSEFLSIASHELRTPLTSMGINLQLSERTLGRLLAADGPDALPASLVGKLRETHTALARTTRQVSRLNRLIGDLLDVSRIAAGRLEMRRARCDVSEAVAEAVRDQRIAWPDRAITLQSPRHAVVVDADAERIEQVVANYLTNALKYSASDQPVTVALRTRGGQARVEVRDHGPGLAPDQQCLIWDEFYRVPEIAPKAGSGVGLGLGLYLCRTIVERHSGRVGVTSAPGTGSTFWFTLPLGDRADRGPEGPTHTAAGASAPATVHGQVRTPVVDDRARLRRSFTTAIGPPQDAHEEIRCGDGTANISGG